jgi:hypothetical protein
LRRIKSILGILLILLSVLGLFLWEWKGREAIMTERVLVAREEIRKGAEIDSSMFLIKGVSKENLLPGALMPDQMKRLQGKVAMQLISENDQIIMRYFSDNEFYLKKGQSIFAIKPGWIAMRSSSLRRGDLIDIYGATGGEILGTYKIAYVKDEADREVRNADVELQRAADTESVLERADSTSVIDHIEIITTYSEYEKLVSYVSGTTGSALVIVQRGDQLDT